MSSTLSYRLASSVIHGVGVFAERFLPSGYVVGPVYDPFPYLTPLGRKVNHSFVPNTILVYSGTRQFLVVSRDIEEGEELTVDYDQAFGSEAADPGWNRV